MNRSVAAMTAALAIAACNEQPRTDSPAATALQWDVEQGMADRVASIEGLAGPEAVRYDPDQDVWFIANFGPGTTDDRDGDGFITRVDAATGAIASLRFATGTEAQPLHMPRGMYITGDTLWVADVDGVHGFDRRSGAAVAFHDFTSHEPGFLNDIALGPDGSLYVTDTGRSALFGVSGGAITQVLGDSILGQPNGVTWDPSRQSFVLVPWAPGHQVRTWRPGEPGTQTLGSATPGRLDGVEAIDGRLLIASQTDSTLQLLDADSMVRSIRVAGAPADIGIDTRRRRVAVPYIALNRVDIWQLPDA